MIRSSTELLDKIAEDLIWRRKELTELKALIEKVDNQDILQKTLMRSAVAILYGHWEGFVKKSSHYYLEFVAAQKLPYNKLTSNFIGLSVKSKFKELGASEKLSAGNDLAEFFCNSLSSRANIPYKSGVDTKSNLSSSVLIDIIATLGLDIRQFETKFKFIDSNLVNVRNHIAHGQDFMVTNKEYEDLHATVTQLIETFRTEIENASVTKKFLIADQNAIK